MLFASFDFAHCVEHRQPAAVFRQGWKSELDLLRRCIEYNEKRRLSGLERAEHVGEKTSFWKIPVRLGHFGRLWRQPQHIERAIRPPTFDKAPPAQLGKGAPQARELRDELGHVLALAAEARPVDPADRIVLAVGVIVAILAVADLVAGED